MATIMRHGDYIAEVEYDPEIDKFYGCVINLSGPVTFYGQTVAELKRELAASIKVYLDVCRERGIEPEKPYSGRFNIRLGPDLHRELAAAAARAGKSLNTWAIEHLARAANSSESAATT